jgi:hypothetical protein
MSPGLLRQPGGFEGFAREPKRVKRTFLGQVILDPDESSMPEPEAMVGLAFKRHAARASRGMKLCMRKDAIIANRPRVLHHLSILAPSRNELSTKAHDLLASVAWPRLRELRTG